MEALCFQKGLDLISFPVFCPTVRDFMRFCATDQLRTLSDMAKLVPRWISKKETKGQMRFCIRLPALEMFIIRFYITSGAQGISSRTK